MRSGNLNPCPNGIAAEPARWQHSRCVQMAVEHGPKRLSGFPELDPFAIRPELLSCSDGVYVHHSENASNVRPDPRFQELLKRMKF